MSALIGNASFQVWREQVLHVSGLFLLYLVVITVISPSIPKPISQKANEISVVFRTGRFFSLRDLLFLKGESKGATGAILPNCIEC